MAKGQRTANIMDIPLSISSVVAPYLGDNGYKFIDMETIRVLSVANGTLVNYDEGDANEPMGTPGLIVPVEQVLTLAYNKAMIGRIQKSQLQDQPLNDFAKKWAIQQADEVFVPAHDEYSLGKIYAARPVGNRVEYDASTSAISDIKVQFSRMIDKTKRGGQGNTSNVISWVAYDFATLLTAAINFTGSDAGYKEGKNGYLGKFKGAKIVETPDDYFDSGVYAITTDKRAVVNVTPKMDPKGDGLTIIEKVPKFGGSEIQLRDRGDTFVLNRKARTVSSLEAPVTPSV